MSIFIKSSVGKLLRIRPLQTHIFLFDGQYKIRTIEAKEIIAMYLDYTGSTHSDRIYVKILYRNEIMTIHNNMSHFELVD